MLDREVLIGPGCDADKDAIHILRIRVDIGAGTTIPRNIVDSC